MGVTSGLAGIKFSGSFKRFGDRRASIDRKSSSIKNPTMSLEVKYQWKGTLSEFEFTPNGLLEPVWCRNSRWIIDKAATTNGIRKCRA